MIITTLTICITVYTLTILALNKAEAKELAPTNIVDAELLAVYTKYTKAV